MSRRIVLGLAMGFALANNSWLLWPLNGDPRVFLGYLSELGAATQPAHAFFRSADLAAALLAVAYGLVAPRLWTGVLGPGRLRWVVGACLSLYGLATLGDAVEPLSCSPTLDPGCPAYVDFADWSAGTAAHAAISTVGELALLATMALVARRAEGSLRRTAVVLLAGTAAAHLTMIVLAATIGGEGVAQGPLLLVEGLWAVRLALAADRGEGDSGPAGNHPADRTTRRRPSARTAQRRSTAR